MWYRLAAALPVSLVAMTPFPLYFTGVFLVVSPEVADKGPGAT
jgi:hypothetical protein